MASLKDIVRRHTQLDDEARDHLRRLVSSWGPLADLSFADLLLFAPVGDDGQRFIVLAQMRPTTAQTLYRDDQLGGFVTAAERPLVAAAMRSGKITEAELDLPIPESRASVVAVPVRWQGKVVAVMTRETPQLGHRSLGDLELAYLGVSERLVQMVSDGTFPFPYEDNGTEESPRVGDGALILDREGTVAYSSPNGVSAFHRLGYHGSVVGRRLVDLGVRNENVRTAYSLRTPVVEELDRPDNVTILVRIVPLITDGVVDGALVLLRDVSELRSRERLMVSMNATIREIHHRVKNNLQTVTSLLRIQERRATAPEAKAAIAEAERRIASIATVHDMLSRGGGDEVVLGEIVRPILAVAEQAAVVPLRVRLVGDGPVVSASTASSLAVILNELVQNAVEHGFPPGSAGGAVTVEMVFDATELTVSVHDNGVGVPAGFDSTAQTGLGLTIINALVESDLGGRLVVRPAGGQDPGTVAELVVRLKPR
ncbi:MAG: sensor histidine kinase [Acidimicrobiales bacterium]